MSTKNLARTVIEGGRARYNKVQRYHSHARHRCAERMVSSRLLCDSELDDVVYPARERVYQGFDAHGILRRKRRTSLLYQPRPWLDEWAFPLPEPRDVLDLWLAGRRVGERTTQFYWFVQTRAGSFRQHHRLTAVEAARWRSLPEWFRDQNDAFKPPSTASG